MANPAIPFKNNGVAFLIAIIAGIFGFCGIGHIYIGKVLRWIFIMMIGWIPSGLALFTILGSSSGESSSMDSGIGIAMMIGILYL